MSPDRKRSFFGSLFGSKRKTEEELEAENESRQKIEERIREVLAINDMPELPKLNQEPAFPASTGFLEIVYSGSDPAHPRTFLQSDAPGIQLPPQESDSNRRIAPKERFRPELEQPGVFESEPWRIRRKAANG
jgi:hypothetical protein